jgi:hypothetical protein
MTGNKKINPKTSRSETGQHFLHHFLFLDIVSELQETAPIRVTPVHPNCPFVAI